MGTRAYGGGTGKVRSHRLGGVDSGADPYFSYVISLAHFDGNHGFTGPFVDQIANRSPGWSQIGSGDALYTSLKKYGTASLSPEGTGVGVYNADHADWNFGSGDFTVECWIYVLASGLTQVIFGQWNSVAGTKAPFLCYVNVNQRIVFGATTTNAAWDWLATGTTIMSTSAWYHVAISREGSTIRGFLNGVEDVSSGTLIGAVVNNTDNVTLGNVANNPGTLALQGYIDDFRATKGIARYTSNFTPPTAAFPNF